MRGYTIEELGMGIGAIVVILIIAAIAFGLSGGLPGMSSTFQCEQNPPSWKFWCFEGGVGDTDYQVAKQSANTLSCAINAVASNDAACADSYKEPSSGSPQGATLSCLGGNVCCKYSQPQQFLPPETLYSYELTNNACTQRQGEVQDTSVCLGQIGPTQTSCTIKNINLPQQVTNAEEWIPDYGDPKFLFYWQSFPLDQDTWSFKTDWKIYAFVGLISVIPPTRVAKVFTETKILDGLISLPVVGEKIGSVLFKYSGKIVTPVAAKDAMKDALKEVLLSRLKQPVKTIIRGTVLEGSVLAAELADSVLGKFDPTNAPNKLVMKTALEGGEAYQLPESWDGKLVLVQFRPQILTSVTTAHLVSPCKIDSTPIEKAAAKCAAYSYNLETKIAKCDGPSFKEKVESTDNNCVTLKDTPLKTFVGKSIDDALTEYKNLNVQTEVKDTDGDSQNDTIVVKYQGGTYSIADYDRNGKLDTYALSDCVVDAIYLKYTEAQGKEGYCVSQKGILRAVLDDIGSYGGYAAVAAGVGAVFLIPGAQVAIPVIGTVGAGALLTTAGTIAITGSEISEAVGGWPG